MQQPLETLFRILTLLRTNLQIWEECPKSMRHSGINVSPGSNSIIFEYLLHDQRAVSHGVQPADLEVRLGEALVSRECQREPKRAVWINLMVLCKESDKNQQLVF